MAGLEHTIEKATAASSGALVTSLFVTPLDVAKVRLQSQLHYGFRLNPAVPPVGICKCCTKSMIRPVEQLPTRPRQMIPCMRMSTCSRMCSGAPLRLNGTFHALKHIFHTEGLSGLFSGLSPTMMIAIPSTVLYYISYDMLLQEGRHRMPEWEGVIPLLSGSSARIVAATVTSPIELIRTRMQGDPKAVGIVSTLSSAIKHGGYTSLFKGLSATLARDVPFSAIYWTAYERLQTAIGRADMVNERLSPTHRAFICGALSGAIAASVTTPFDVVKTLQQVDKKNGARFQGQSGAVILKDLIHAQGVRGAFTGLSARLARVAPSCAIMISTYEFAKNQLGVQV